MLGRIVGAVRFKEPLSFHTSLHIGGPAEFFIEPQDLDDVRYALAFADQEALPVMTIGEGNNLLVADGGIRGVVLKLQGVFARTEFHGNEALAGAGVNLGAFIRAAAARGLGGLEHLAGIPGTLGGALATNVRTQEGSLIGACGQIYFLYPDGTVGEIRLAARASYEFELPAGSVIFGCRMTLSRRRPVQIEKEIHRRHKLKRATEPVALASAGYVWRNPASLETAAQLIASAGLRGKRVKNIEISSKCANFIVSRGSASAFDVLQLMQMTRERVAADSGVTLQADIRTHGVDATSFEPQRLALATV
jgi:UDP-N-acetylmuramate dehydrogenase